jgi:mannose-6-phosphate isomerase-like protein (cupin superfamily)
LAGSGLSATHKLLPEMVGALVTDSYKRNSESEGSVKAQSSCLGALASCLVAISPVLLAASTTQTTQVMAFGDSVRARDRLAPTPQFAALVPGLYARRIVQTTSKTGDYRVEIWALLVSPGAKTQATHLPGAAVLTLRSGSAELRSGELATALAPGSIATVPEGTAFQLANSDATRPAVLHAVVLSGEVR